MVERIDLLRQVVREVQERHPFRIHGWVVLPEHLHALLELPQGDTNFPLRWRRIKSQFSRAIPNSEARSESRWQRGERGIWQRRYWEHLIRDQEDFNNHLDYIHINPVKHGSRIQIISATLGEVAVGRLTACTLRTQSATDERKDVRAANRRPTIPDLYSACTGSQPV